MNEKKINQKYFPKSLIIIYIVIFYSIAIGLWIFSGSLFYFMNFLTIGNSLVLGLGIWGLLSKEKSDIGRHFSQTLVGAWMFFGIGFGLIFALFGRLSPENMQIEGFWFRLFAFTFTGTVIHYFVSKIIGTFLFNRGWCGWACWTAALLDYLPWKESKGRIKNLGLLRYVIFIFNIILVLFLVLRISYTESDISGDVTLNGEDGVFNSIWEIPELWWFLIGNIIYYVSGIILAAILKDNRAFCKYLCPITCFLKIGSKYSLMKIEGNAQDCTSCGLCEKSCPMDIKISEYIKNDMRVSSSECILCLKCIKACPNQNLLVSTKITKPTKNILNYKN